MHISPVETSKGCMEDDLSKGFTINLILSSTASSAQALSPPHFSPLSPEMTSQPEESVCLGKRPHKEAHLGKSQLL